MSESKKHLKIGIVIVVIVAIIVLIIIVVVIVHNKNSGESFVPGDYGKYYISNDGRNKSGFRVLSELMHNSNSLYLQISTGSYPNFATIYGVFNNYKLAMEKHKNDRIEEVDDLVDDMMRYLAVNSNVFNSPAPADEWRLLERKLIT